MVRRSSTGQDPAAVATASVRWILPRGFLVPHDVSSELSQLSDLVHQAEGKMSVLLGLPIDQAVTGLEFRAQFRGISLAEAAEQVMEGHAAVGERELEKLRQHLGGAGIPLDQVG